MGSTLLTFLAFTAAAEPTQPDVCPTRDARLDLVEAAERALVEADLAGAERKLRELEAALGCGPFADRDLLARMWLVEGAWLTLGADEAAAESWQAAARVAPEVWNPDYGDQLRADYEKAASATRSRAPTTLSVDPELFRWIGAVDGEPVRRFPIDVEPGLHLVQVGATDADVRFSRVVMAFPATPVVVVTGLVEPTTEPEPQAETPEPREVDEPLPPVEHPPLSLHVAVGGSVGLGGSGDEEPSVKVVVPIETGLVVRPTNAVWLRPTLRAGPLVNGDYAYDDAFGATTSPSTVGGSLSGGLAGRQGDLGLLVGYHWPDRVAFRGTVGVVTGRFPARVEGRLGLDAPLGGSPETAFDVLLAFNPRLIRHRPDAEE